MSPADVARGTRQTAILAAIVGLHFAVFLVIAAGLVPPEVFKPPERMKVRLLPKPLEPEPVDAPRTIPIVDDFFFREAYPEPVIPIPAFPQGDPVTEKGDEGAAGKAANIDPPVEIVPPSLRTRPASVAAAINACYPAASRRMNEEGTVVALVTIGAGGSAVDWSVARSSGFTRLDAAIGCVLRKLDFVAGRRDGRGVSAAARLPIVFRLD